MSAFPKGDDLPGLLVVGTDTGVGKTRVTAWLALRLVADGATPGVCKPTASGAEFRDGRWVWDDAEILKAACPVAAPDDLICRYRYRAPLAPPLARRWDLAHPDPSAPPPGKAPTVDDFLELFDE
ncbi:MAG: ATP-dependent dethiobiotin synthetase BioD, partial [Planctomycetia bacterium]